MPPKNRNLEVKMVRIQREGKPSPTTYKEDVTVGMPKDNETNAVYLRIAVNGKTIMTEELDNFQWLDESCSAGVTTLESKSTKIVIVYDAKDRQLRDFFTQMEDYYHDDKEKISPEPVITEDRTENVTDDLLKAIADGSSDAAEHGAKYLAKNRTKIQFKLINNSDKDEDNDRKRKKSTAESSTDVLELKLQVECHLNKEPLLETIYVRSGTKLYELKEEIETKTGIKTKDQYWFAFGQYIIHDEYEFGSDKPVVPPRAANAPKKQPLSPKEPIKSGDTLIMCIAQMSPI